MPTYITRSKIASAESNNQQKPKNPGDDVTERIRSACPGVAWKGSYANTGRYDAIDVFEADSPKEAACASTILHSLGRAPVVAGRRVIRGILTNAILLGLSTAFLVHFWMIVAYGRFYVQESKPVILLGEIAMMVSFIWFGFDNLLKMRRSTSEDRRRSRKSTD